MERDDFYAECCALTTQDSKRNEKKNVGLEDYFYPPVPFNSLSLIWASLFEAFRIDKGTNLEERLEFEKTP